MDAEECEKWRRPGNTYHVNDVWERGRPGNEAIFRYLVGIAILKLLTSFTKSEQILTLVEGK